MNDERADIVLVEDNAFEAKLAIYNLRKHNLIDHLVHFSDGEQAADYIFGKGEYESRDISNRPKLVLLDINLPKVHGMELLNMIKTDPLTCSIPVVILTSSGDCKDIAEGYALGANSYIVKPLDFDSFSRTVSNLSICGVISNYSPQKIDNI